MDTLAPANIAQYLQRSQQLLEDAVLELGLELQPFQEIRVAAEQELTYYVRQTTLENASKLGTPEYINTVQGLVTRIEMLEALINAVAAKRQSINS